MQINTCVFLNTETLPLNFTGEVSVPEGYGVVGNSVLASFDGIISSLSGVFRLSGQLKASADFRCDRCLTPVRNEIDVDIDEKFSETAPGNTADDDIWEVVSDIIDLTPPITSAILLNLPVKVLCAEDCKGLCPYCGAFLNSGSCGCGQSHIDPRWDGLRSFLKQ